MFSTGRISLRSWIRIRDKLTVLLAVKKKSPALHINRSSIINHVVNNKRSREIKSFIFKIPIFTAVEHSNPLFR
jgi:hypothetical protein